MGAAVETAGFITSAAAGSAGAALGAATREAFAVGGTGGAPSCAEGVKGRGCTRQQKRHGKTAA